MCWSDLLGVYCRSIYICTRDQGLNIFVLWCLKQMVFCTVISWLLHFCLNSFLAGKDRDGRQVIDGHDTFVLIASTIEEMDQWVGVINRIIYQVEKYMVSFQLLCCKLQWLNYFLVFHTIIIINCIELHSRISPPSKLNEMLLEFIWCFFFFFLERVWWCSELSLMITKMPSDLVQ